MKIFEVKKQLNSIGLTNDEINLVLTEVLKLNLAQIVLQDEIFKKQQKKIDKIAKRVKKNLPINLIFKKQNFFGREFITKKNVLKPRLDTEILVDCALKETSANSKVLDICCGSGIVGITINLEKKCNVSLCDISASALRLTKKNAKKLGANVFVFKSNMFKNTKEKYDVICCNPPYIKTQTISNLDKTVKKFDPILALDGGEDGLKFYRILRENFLKFLNKNGVLLMEIGFDQAKEVCKLFKDFDCEVIKDYNKNDRVVVVKERKC